MKQRVNLITLGVADLARSRAFYAGLGWQTGAELGDDVVFFQAGEMVVALWDRARLAEDSAVEDGGVRLGRAEQADWPVNQSTPDPDSLPADFSPIEGEAQ